MGIALAAAAYTYQVTYDGRIYLGVSSMGVDLSGYTRDEARTILAASLQRFARTPVTLRHKGREWRPLPEELGIGLEFQDTVDDAYAVGREGNPLQRLQAQLSSLGSGRSVGSPRFVVDSARRTVYLTRLAREIDQAPIDAQISVKPRQDGGAAAEIAIQRERVGQKLQVVRTAQVIDQRIKGENATAGQPRPEAMAGQSLVAPIALDLVVEEIRPAVTEQALAQTVDLARRLTSSPITLRLANKTWAITPAQLQGLLAVKEAGADPAMGQRRFEVSLDDAGLSKLLEDLTREAEQKPRNARFDYSGGQLKAISKGAEGSRVDVPAAVAAVKASLTGGERVVELKVVPVKPAVGPEDGAKLGIQSLIEQASTAYDVGTAERRHNVELAASRLHGVVVAPGETFSFNAEVGEVSYRSGYKQGYGITQGSDGEILTIPSEGGGICQVATTLFHGVFWAGYPIVERNWHLYWIPRYGMPPKGLKGLDATIDQIFDKQGNLISQVDFRFRNNTERYLLIQARYDKKNVTFQLYGTKPGWEVKVDEPKIDKVVKADPAPVRQLDPAMAPGAEMMIEEARDGFQAAITRTVSQDGKVLEKRTFLSTYRPSRNVYVHGPKPTPTPSPTPSSTPGPTASISPASTPGASPSPGASPQTTPAPARTPTAPPKPAASPAPKPTAAP